MIEKLPELLTASALTVKLTLLSLLFGIILGWGLFITLIPQCEFTEFINITLSMYTNVDYYDGLIYPTAFLSGFAFNSSNSASNNTFSSNSSTPSPVLADTS